MWTWAWGDTHRWSREEGGQRQVGRQGTSLLRTGVPFPAGGGGVLLTETGDWRPLESDNG